MIHHRKSKHLFQQKKVSKSSVKFLTIIFMCTFTSVFDICKVDLKQCILYSGKTTGIVEMVNGFLPYKKYFNN